ncbi:hypothetical protein PWT90_03301 [Aphanocladium album]|nr:hypothetical protein PWT90_03301 [Aphanocladium album]
MLVITYYELNNRDSSELSPKSTKAASPAAHTVHHIPIVLRFAPASSLTTIHKTPSLNETPAVAPRQPLTLHFLKTTRLLLLSCLVVLLAVTLAPQRYILRIGSLAQQLRKTPLIRKIPIAQRFVSTMASEKFANPPQQPPLFNYTPESIEAKIDEIVALHRKAVDDVVASTTPETATFENTLKPILEIENLTHGDNFRACFVQNASPDAAVREASLKADGRMRELDIELRMRDDIFQRVKAVYDNQASANLDAESTTILGKEYKQYINKGLLLPPGPERDHFKKQQLELSRLCLECSNNHNNETGGIWFTPEQLEGIPQTDVDVDTLEKGTGENEGKVKADFKYTTSLPLLKYAKHEATRRDYCIADANKVSSFLRAAHVNQNVPLFQTIIELRDEAARQVGYKDHADLIISAKMAKDSEKVKSFLADIRTRVGDGGKAEIEALRELKKQDYAERGLEFDGEIYTWDISYYTRILKQKEYNLDENEVAEYFPLWKTFTGMLEIFEKILGLHFVELDEAAKARLSPTGNAKDIVWHDEVILLSVWNDEASGGEFVGYLYIDLHPRPNKYSHNANFNLGAGYLKTDGTRNYPVTSLVCNFSRPSKDRPALLKHGEVVTLFHELGHGIHDLVGRTKYTYTHGTFVMWDFVEAPSQMLENWCWTPDVLQGLSSHWETGDKISTELIGKLMKTKTLNEMMGNLTQVFIGTFDMTVHTPESHEAAKQLNCGRVWNQLRGEITGVKGPEDVGYGLEWGQKHATIGHFVGGYDAGYYGYMYSKVFSTDMFYTAFKANPMDGEVGRRYRKLVLERGGSMDENVILKEFLGREPNPENFYKDLGLA